MRVAYLGPPGTYSHEALLRLDGVTGWGPVAMPTVHAAILAVQDGRAERALVPIENSLEGSVNATLDALALEADRVEITAEVVHPIHHCLVAGERTDLAGVRVVHSHPQALGQCAEFLRRELPGVRTLPAASTAEAIRAVAEADDGGAAIGPRSAAELYGARVLRTGIEDTAGNETRFAWLAPAGTGPELVAGVPAGGAHKTAIVWWGTGSGSPGWLVRCLSEFAFRGVNLTRIESRPRRELGMGEYMFFADLTGWAGEPPVSDAIEGLRAHASTVRVLGSFAAAP